MNSGRVGSSRPESLQLLEGTAVSQPLYSLSLSLLRSEAVRSAPSCLTGVAAFHICIYLELLMGGGKFSILLHQ